MSRDEAAAVGNLWDPQLAARDRVRLYLYWVHQYQDELRRELKQYGLTYDDASQELQELRMLEDRNVLQNAAVIGMTTTGAARYRSVLTDVACPIVIIEEAAEVMEAHVVTSLHAECQHLILIGDHQQLRPSPTVYELCRRYHLDLSLFERLINNDLPHASLVVQHRMRPEISKLVRHVYPDLEDHPKTQGRDHIRGMTSDVFFFSHQAAESLHTETSSKSNQHEAELCVRLCRYLIQQGYGATAITILVAYTGQLLLINGLIGTDKKFFEGVRVTSVDNYQGEENDVIILSLVRSNEEGKVGFLSTDNRVCVALSRAKNGLYAFGNFQLLSEKSELWRKVVRTAWSHGQYGTELVLRCENHPHTEVKATTAKDFDRVPEGGCQLPCKSPLEGCSHLCTLFCHGYDKDHEMYRCVQPCERILCSEQHRCPRKCYEACGKCMHLVQRTVPKCGHTQIMPCSSRAEQWSCREPCGVRLPACGHMCSNHCGECRRRETPQHVKECPVKVERLWTCGHTVTSTCSVPAGALPCRHPCDVILDCGHPCGGTCGQCWGGRVHVACRARCDQPREGCGHACRSPCGALCLPCPEPCPETCPHRPACPLPCGIPCPPCSQRCVWSCPHRPCRALCSELCPPCDQPCGTRKLRCGHPCRAPCGETCVCPLCERARVVALAEESAQEDAVPLTELAQDAGLFLKLPTCGHIFRVRALDAYVAKTLESLPLGAPLTCPVCPSKRIFVHSTWRFCAELTVRRAQQQRVKEVLMQSREISDDQQHVLQEDARSLKLWDTQDALRGSPAAAATDRTTWDANHILARRTQIRLAYVLSTLSDVDNSQVYAQDFLEDRVIFRTFLQRPLKAMSGQQQRQLKAEARRLLYRDALLVIASRMADSSESRERDEDNERYRQLKRPALSLMTCLTRRAEKLGEVWARLERELQILSLVPQDKLPGEEQMTCVLEELQFGLHRRVVDIEQELAVIQAEDDKNLSDLIHVGHRPKPASKQRKSDDSSDDDIQESVSDDSPGKQPYVSRKATTSTVASASSASPAGSHRYPKQDLGRQDSRRERPFSSRFHGGSSRQVGDSQPAVRLTHRFVAHGSSVHRKGDDTRRFGKEWGRDWRASSSGAGSRTKAPEGPWR